MYFNKALLLSELYNLLGDLREEELSKNTLKKYKTNIFFFIEFVDNKEIVSETISDFKQLLLEKYTSENTINSYIISANKFLNYLGYKDLCVKVEKIQRKTSSKDYINYTDYHRLLRISLKKETKKMHFIMRVLGEVGIRVAELKFFRVETLDTGIKVKNKGKTRIVIVKKDLLAALRRYAREEHIYSGYLFPGKNKSTPIHDSTVRRNLKRLAGKARVKKSKVHPHSFRHYFATRFLIANPGDLRTLQELMGHEDINTTTIYTLLSDSEKEQKIRGIKF